jgi:hypothetical protein
VNGQATAMTNALVAADLDFATDVCRNFTAQVSFNLEVAFDVVTKRDQLVIGQILHTDLSADFGIGEGLECPRTANTVDVSQGDLNALIARDVDASKTCHSVSPSWSLWR